MTMMLLSRALLATILATHCGAFTIKSATTRQAHHHSVYPREGRRIIRPPPPSAVAPPVGGDEHATTTTALFQSPVSKMVDDVRVIYDNLKSPADPAVTTRRYSPTIQFVHVPSPDVADATVVRIAGAGEGEELRDGDAINGIAADDDADDASLKSYLDVTNLPPGEIYDQIASSHNRTKPLALYLPGLDGTGISAHWQYDDLSRSFEFWRMVVDTDDRSSFGDLTRAVSDFVGDVATKTGREVVLMGESFGGLLAPAVAMRLRGRGGAHAAIRGMVLVNPATSFDETRWSTLGPLLTTLRHLEEEEEGVEVDGASATGNGGRNGRRRATPYSVLGALTLAASIPDRNQFGRIVDMFRSVSVTTTDELDEMLESMYDGFGILAENIPAGTLQHRLSRWLPVGTAVVNPRLSSLVNVTTVVVAGGEDNMLPTRREAERLVKTLPNCTRVQFNSAGHLVLDERVNLTKIILDSNIFPAEDYDPILDWCPPTPDVAREKIDSRVNPLRALASPVFFSTDGSGRRHKGLSRVPGGGNGPLLFVANHQFAGLDLGMIVAQMLEDRNVNLRGLAHPLIFQQSQQADVNGAGQDGDFETFGAVMVTPRNYYRLMQTGQTALLFPGGVREVFHGKDEAYQLFWPEKVDFVRIAARFNATIVPLSAIGAADSVNILVDAPDMLRLPFGLGERVANSSRNIVAARYDADGNESELFAPPFALPKPLPARHYFMFGRPMRTDGIDHGDRDACEGLYGDIQKEMVRGFDDLLRGREKDPFGDSARRIPFELLTGKPAPTFGVDELH